MTRLNTAQKTALAQRTADAKKATWRTVPLTVIASLLTLIGDDGHSAYDPSAFVEMGVPQPLVDRYTETYKYKRGMHPKAVLFGANGELIKESSHVYGLRVLGAICNDLGIPTDHEFMGRGWIARFLTDAIREHLAKNGIETVKEPVAA